MPRVAHAQVKEFAGLMPIADRMWALAFEPDRAELQLDGPPDGHRVTGVGDEVQKNLFHSAGVGLGGGKFLGRTDVKLDGLRKDAPHGADEFVYQVPEVYGLELQPLLATKGQQLADHFRPSPGGVLDVAKAVHDRALGIFEILLQQ